MTARRTWKLVEQRACEALEGRRNPLSGSNSQHGTSSDCIECKLLPNSYVEVKMRANWAHHTLFHEVKEKAREENRMPVLITHVKNNQDDLVTLRLDDFAELLRLIPEEERKRFFSNNNRK